MIRVVVIEDHPLFRRALSGILQTADDVHVVAVATSGETGVEAVRMNMPDIALVDLRMPGLNGVDVIRLLSALPVPALALTATEDREDVLRALSAGARGYVVKAAAQQEILQAIRAVCRGESWLSPRIASHLIAEFTCLPATVARERLRGNGDLTEREQAVLSCLARGMTNQEIGKRLYIAETTVKTHMNNIFKKLHVRNRVEAAAVAFRVGLAEEGPDRVASDQRTP